MGHRGVSGGRRLGNPPRRRPSIGSLGLRRNRHLCSRPLSQLLGRRVVSGTRLPCSRHLGPAPWPLSAACMPVPLARQGPPRAWAHSRWRSRQPMGEAQSGERNCRQGRALTGAAATLPHGAAHSRRIPHRAGRLIRLQHQCYRRGLGPHMRRTQKYGRSPRPLAAPDVPVAQSPPHAPPHIRRHPCAGWRDPSRRVGDQRTWGVSWV